MKKEFQIFKTEMDSWVKDFNSQLNDHSEIHSLVKEHDDNIDHNYEMIMEMRSEMSQLKEELAALRLVQLLHLKSELQLQKSKNQ